MWEKEWNKAPIIEDEPCRGCLIIRSIYTGGHRNMSVRQRAMLKEIRETSSGAYCFDCFSILPACPTCGVVPSSHAEYPCVKCEMIAESSFRMLSEGRTSSSAYRGWSTSFHGKGQDNEPKSKRKIKKEELLEIS